MYYFAYGSNMVIEHMRRLCGRHFVMAGQAQLSNYDMQPDLRGYLNIRPTPGKTVYGILFKVEQEAVDALDKFEGHPNVFGRKEVEVIDDERKTRKAWAYIEPEHQFGGSLVRSEYLKRVLGAAIDHNLPQEWIAKIESFESF